MSTIIELHNVINEAKSVESDSIRLLEAIKKVDSKGIFFRVGIFFFSLHVKTTIFRARRSARKAELLLNEMRADL